MSTETLNTLMSRMWQDYLQICPDAERIHRLFCELNPQIINDHIALRTLNLPGLGIDQLAATFEREGYVAADEYRFPAKKLYARHYEHPDAIQPKIFISELLTEALSEDNQSLLHRLIAQVPDSTWQQADFCCSGRHWQLEYTDYQALRTESEYAAWFAAFGWRPNHFTILVNALESHPSIASVNDFLLSQGFRLNSAGGLIKGTPDDFLEQSSTLAAPVMVDFSDTRALIPGCYYEFARRYPRPDGRLYQGFVAASADRIFESTDHQNSTG